MLHQFHNQKVALQELEIETWNKWLLSMLLEKNLYNVHSQQYTTCF